MYKFLVVDDEEIVRRGFRKKIPWEEMGFEYLEPCQNGREAIDRINKDHPDVIMTDICMPLVDGLEIANYVADNYPEIMVFILSGYEEFEYARSALRSRVVEYLLKPITSQELSGLVSKLKIRLDQNDQKINGIRTSNKKIGANLNNNQVHKHQMSLASVKVLEAQEYIKDHYSQKELSMDDVCRELYISPSYLSRLLKQHLGKTFVDALTEYRINKAKDLLFNSNLKTYAIADAVGISDPHYFSTIFKKVTGMPPSVYRDNSLKSVQM